MPRQGYLIVEKSDRLFSSSTSAMILSDLEKMIRSLANRAHSQVGAIKFSLVPLSRSGRTAGKMYQQICSGPDNQDIRLVYTEDDVAASLLCEWFGGSDLIVAASKSKSGATEISATRYPRIVRAHINPESVPRFVQDLFLDISLGNFFRGAGGPIAQLASQHSLDALYREKARFFFAQRGRSWLTLRRSAKYAPLSSLNRLDPEDFPGRAREAFATWTEFSDWLSLRRAVTRNPRAPRPNSNTGSADAGSEGAPPQNQGRQIDISDLATIPKVGGQLPLAAIRKDALLLAEGDYALLVQRKGAMGRTSPTTKDKLKYLFGLKSRPNSYIFVAQNDTNIDAQLVIDLISSGHIEMHSVRVSGRNADHS